MAKRMNDYELFDNHAIGHLFGREDVFYVDIEDYERIKNKCWSYAHGYANASINGKRVYLHRFLMDCPRDMVIDHINHNTLDNRKENLRICTKAQNNRNVTETCQNSSGRRGVRRNTKKNRWNASIQYDNKEIFLGAFVDKADAIRAREEAEKKYYGEFAYKEALR